MEFSRVLLHGLGFGLAIMESVARLNNREPDLPAVTEHDDDGIPPYDDTDELSADDDTEAKPRPLIPDSLAEVNLARPGLGQHLAHANTLMEQAAALGALKDGLQASGFDADEAWILTRMYARLWWSTTLEREFEDLDEDDD